MRLSPFGMVYGYLKDYIGIRKERNIFAYGMEFIVTLIILYCCKYDKVLYKLDLERCLGLLKRLCIIYNNTRKRVVLYSVL